MLSGHRGIQTTYNKIRDRYFWKNMYNEVSNYCNTCQECNKKKVTNEIKAPLQPIPTERPFQTIGMDLIGPLPTTEVGNKYILVFIDALTKWSEAVPIIGIIAKHLYEHIICRHGTPENIITDSAKNFTATVLTEVCKILRIDKIHTTPYHPEGNGLVERVNGTLIKMVAMYVSENQTNWDSVLPGVLFGYRTSKHKSTKETPFQLLYGRRARLPNDVTTWTPPNINVEESQQTKTIVKSIQIAQEIARDNNKQNQIKMKEYYDKKTKPHVFEIGDKVLLRDTMKKKGKNPKFLPKYKGPYTLVKQITPVTFELGGTHSKMENTTSHVNRMKKYVGIENRIITPESVENITHLENTEKNSYNQTQLENHTENNTDINTPVETNKYTNNNQEKNNPEEIIWDDNLIILKHRNKHQRIDYLIKRKD